MILFSGHIVNKVECFIPQSIQTTSDTKSTRRQAYRNDHINNKILEVVAVNGGGSGKFKGALIQGIVGRAHRLLRPRAARDAQENHAYYQRLLHHFWFLWARQIVNCYHN